MVRARRSSLYAHRTLHSSRVWGVVWFETYLRDLALLLWHARFAAGPARLCSGLVRASPPMRDDGWKCVGERVRHTRPIGDTQSLVSRLKYANLELGFPTMK